MGVPPPKYPMLPPTHDHVRMLLIKSTLDRIRVDDNGGSMMIPQELKYDKFFWKLARKRIADLNEERIIRKERERAIEELKAANAWWDVVDIETLFFPDNDLQLRHLEDNKYELELRR